MRLPFVGLITELFCLIELKLDMLFQLYYCIPTHCFYEISLCPQDTWFTPTKQPLHLPTHQPPPTPPTTATDIKLAGAINTISEGCKLNKLTELYITRLFTLSTYHIMIDNNY